MKKIILFIAILLGSISMQAQKYDKSLLVTTTSTMVSKAMPGVTVTSTDTGMAMIIPITVLATEAGDAAYYDIYMGMLENDNTKKSLSNLLLTSFVEGLGDTADFIDFGVYNISLYLKDKEGNLYYLGSSDT
ncbi:MAG: hypothetical protein KAH32_03525 [Chlamydiia bacterium]|nr:hypothetical protein [Chlamydiia bacterium]